MPEPAAAPTQPVPTSAQVNPSAQPTSPAPAAELRYILELAALAPHVQAHAHVVAPLVRAMTKAGAERVERWKLAVNASVEPDL